MPRRYGLLYPGQLVDSPEMLCRFLGGDLDGFTGLLLTAIDVALPADRMRLRRVYPSHVAAIECWRAASGPVTAEQLAQLMARKAHR